MKRSARIVAVSTLVVLGLAGVTACGASSPTAAPVTPGTQPTTSPKPMNSNSSSPSSPSAPATKEVNQPGDIPDDQAFVTWKAPTGNYSIQVPEGWARSQSGGATGFTDKLNSITAVEHNGPKPTIASITANVKQIKKTSTGWVGGDVTSTTRTAGPVILATYRADVPADPVTNKVINDDVEQYTFWKSGKVVTLTLAGPHGADNVDPWRTVTDSFTWL